MNNNDSMANTSVDVNSIDDTILTINVDDTISGDTIDLSGLSTFNFAQTALGAAGVAGAQGSAYTITSNGGTGNSWYNSTGQLSFNWNDTPAGLEVKGDANFEGDLKIKGVSLADTLSKIEQRLFILRPDPEKLEHFEALRKAYEHYKTLEALCQMPKKTEE